MPTLKLLGVEVEEANLSKDYAGSVATTTRGIFRATVREFTPTYKMAGGYGAHWELRLSIAGISGALAQGRTNTLEEAIKDLDNKASELARETIAIAEMK